MKEVIQDFFDHHIIDIKNLDGYENNNYLIITQRDKCIFKTYQKNSSTALILRAENEVLIHLNKTDSNIYPRPIAFPDGAYIKEISINGCDQICRILLYLPGNLLGNSTHDAALFQSLGKFMANMNLSLNDFESQTIKNRVWEWDIQHLHLNKKFITDIENSKNQKIVQHYFHQYEKHVAAIIPSLRKQIIHNDANEWNLLVTDNQISGIIDFGDLCYAPLINELAVCICYACIDKTNPLKWACIILKAYHKILPLKIEELNILYYLVAARLCVSVCNSSHSRLVNPDNHYAFSSEENAWSMLHIWKDISPEIAFNAFKNAIDQQ